MASVLKSSGYLGETTPSSSPCDELLEELRAALEKDLVSRFQAPAPLKAARLEYIKAKMIYQLLDQMGSADERGLGQTTLQGARAAQLLLLPAQLLGQDPLPLIKADDALAGSSSHCLGVQPPKHLGREQSNSEVDSIMSALAQQLGSWMDKWLNVLKLGATSRHSKDDQGPSSGAGAALGVSGQLSMQVVQQVADRREGLAARQQAVRRQLLQVLRAVVQLLGLYQSMDQSMLGFVEGEILQHQAQLDQKHLAYDVSWVELMEAKLRSIELQVQSATYSHTHVAALQRMDGLMQEMLGGLKHSLQQVSLNLAAYQALGPSFSALAAEYGSVRRQVAEAQRMLASFNAFEAELNEQDDFS